MGKGATQWWGQVKLYPYKKGCVEKVHSEGMGRGGGGDTIWGSTCTDLVLAEMLEVLAMLVVIAISSHPLRGEFYLVLRVPKSSIFAAILDI